MNKCKPASMPARLVQKYVKNVQKSVRECMVWKSAKGFAGPVLMPAANVQKNAGI